MVKPESEELFKEGKRGKREKRNNTQTEACRRMNHFGERATPPNSAFTVPRGEPAVGAREVKGCADCGEARLAALGVYRSASV